MIELCMSSSTKNQSNKNFFERKQDIIASNLLSFNEVIGDYYGEVSNSVVPFRILSKQKGISSEIFNCKNLIKDLLKQELHSTLKQKKVIITNSKYWKF
jgi:Zn-dependent peptidase ImmA (M78 family)